MVAAFLREEPHASLLPVAALLGGPSRPGSLTHTLRFEPRASQTSALFVARIGKAKRGTDSEAKSGTEAEAKRGTDAECGEGEGEGVAGALTSA